MMRDSDHAYVCIRGLPMPFFRFRRSADFFAVGALLINLGRPVNSNPRDAYDLIVWCYLKPQNYLWSKTLVQVRKSHR